MLTFHTTLRFGRKKTSVLEGGITISGLEKLVFLKIFFKTKILKIPTLTVNVLLINAEGFLNGNGSSHNYH